jgi:hypothetical protein
MKEFPDGAKLFLLNYVDDILYYRTDQRSHMSLKNTWETTSI